MCHEKSIMEIVVRTSPPRLRPTAYFEVKAPRAVSRVKRSEHRPDINPGIRPQTSAHTQSGSTREEEAETKRSYGAEQRQENRKIHVHAPWSCLNVHVGFDDSHETGRGGTTPVPGYGIQEYRSQTVHIPALVPRRFLLARSTSRLAATRAIERSQHHAPHRTESLA
ncbi:hypothetical protein BC628DRAFT_701576 [Trametes gibbosa]|nr:hypothetical protein BC628DRAFT_701576 [Trametes gibbosa]